MRPFRALAALAIAGAAALLPGCAAGGGASTPAPPRSGAVSDLPQPPELRSVNGVLHVALQAQLDPVSGGPSLTYGGAPVPPTLRVRPDDLLAVDYINAVPTAVTPPNMTSLHFHGLSVRSV